MRLTPSGLMIDDDGMVVPTGTTTSPSTGTSVPTTQAPIGASTPVGERYTQFSPETIALDDYYKYGPSGPPKEGDLEPGRIGPLSPESIALDEYYKYGPSGPPKEGDLAPGRIGPLSPESIALDDYYKYGPSGKPINPNDPSGGGTGTDTGGTPTAPVDPGPTAAQLRQAMLDEVLGNTRNATNSYFTSHGADPNKYHDPIEQRLTSILAGIPGDVNSGFDTYFSGAPASIYNTQRDQQRQQSLSTFDSLFSDDYGSKRLPFTSDDSVLSQIEAEQRKPADDIVANMLARGQINQSGVNAANADIERQLGGAHSRLNEIGTGLLTQGQSQLQGFRTEGRTAANNRELDDAYDPNTYTSEADSFLNDFLGSLGSNIRGQISSPLVSSKGLSKLALQGSSTGPLSGAIPNGGDGEDELNRSARATVF